MNNRMDDMIPADARHALEAEIKALKARLRDMDESLDLLAMRTTEACMRSYEVGKNKGLAEGYERAVAQRGRLELVK